MENELEVRQSPADEAALMISSAIEKGISAEGIEKLAEVYLKMQALKAEQEFTAALLLFRKHCPPIFKTDEGVHRRKFAPLYKITKIVDPVLMDHGLSYTWNTQLLDNQVVSDCTLRHVGGHSTTTRFAAPIAPAPGMSQTHAAASAASLANRYALQFALGIVTEAMLDDDGNAATQGELISPDQQATLQVLIDEVKPEMKSFWNYCKVSRLEDLSLKDFGRVHRALLDKKKGGAK